MVTKGFVSAKVTERQRRKLERYASINTDDNLSEAIRALIDTLPVVPELPAKTQKHE